MNNTMVFKVKSGGSFAVGLGIDQFLADKDVEILYEKWKSSWGVPLEYRGGQTLITCDMVAEVPVDELVTIYGKKVAARLITASLNA